MHCLVWGYNVWGTIQKTSCIVIIGLHNAGVCASFEGYFVYWWCSVLLIQVEFFTLRWLEHFSINFSLFLRDISALLGGTTCWAWNDDCCFNVFSDIWGGNSSQGKLIANSSVAMHLPMTQCLCLWLKAEFLWQKFIWFVVQTLETKSSNPCENKWIIFPKSSCRVEGFVNFSCEKGIWLTCFFKIYTLKLCQGSRLCGIEPCWVFEFCNSKARLQHFVGWNSSDFVVVLPAMILGRKACGLVWEHLFPIEESQVKGIWTTGVFQFCGTSCCHDTSWEGGARGSTWVGCASLYRAMNITRLPGSIGMMKTVMVGNFVFCVLFFEWCEKQKGTQTMIHFELSKS